MKNFQIVSLENDQDPEYDAELEQEIDRLREQKIKEEKAIKQKKVSEEAFLELGKLKKIIQSFQSNDQHHKNSSQFAKKATPQKLQSNIISMEYNISNSEKVINKTPLIKVSSSILEEKKDFFSSGLPDRNQNKVKFPVITSNSQKFLSDKSNELENNQKEISSLENIPNQAELMFSNIKIKPGVKYSDNIGNIKTNENKNYSPQIFAINPTEKPIRMSRSDYLNMVKNQGNFIRKKYIAEENNLIKNKIPTIHPKISSIQEKELKYKKNPKIDIIDEKSQHLENDGSFHEGIEKPLIIDRVGNRNENKNNYNYKFNVENNKGKKKNENIIVINNPLYLKELLLCD